MSGAKTLVRELAAWGLDQDEYRPAFYRGHPESAQALVSKRMPVQIEAALVAPGDFGLRERFAEQESRADLHAEMAGLDWFLGVVDLRLLLAFQRRIILDPEVQDGLMPAPDNWDHRMDFCFAKPAPVVCDTVRSKASILLCSTNPNLYFHITDDSSRPITIHTGSPFFEVAQYRNRWFLRDGYHRAFRCLQSGVCLLPAVIVRARTLEELGAMHP